MRIEYRMTEEDLAELMEACKSAPCIALQCGMPRSPQERANTAWAKIGDKYGFRPMSVRPVQGKGQRYFTAEAICPGVKLSDGSYSGCTQKGGDCPTCGK